MLIIPILIITSLSGVSQTYVAQTLGVSIVFSDLHGHRHTDGIQIHRHIHKNMINYQTEKLGTKLMHTLYKKIVFALLYSATIGNDL